jgi:hypothetical protein
MLAGSVLGAWHRNYRSTGEWLGDALREHCIAVRNGCHPSHKLGWRGRAVRRKCRVWLDDPNAGLDVECPILTGIADLLQIRQAEQVDVVLTKPSIGHPRADRGKPQMLFRLIQLQV